MFSAKISETPLHLETLLQALSHPQAGARVLFSGEVRAANHGKEVIRLEYTAHRTLAEKHMFGVIEAAKQQFSLLAALCVHRVGLVEISESAVVVLTLGRHRRETYAANQYIIDRVKAETPIWKKEFFGDGTFAWGKNCDDHA